ncbi:MAG: ABC transporter permease [Gammaproteobacteria bacterium]|nr:ABC transporter permease [Gammaproteobacteria bacterium]
MTLLQQWVALKTIVVKEFMRFIRIWIQTVIPAAIMTMLYFVIIGKLIGSRLGTMHGIPYVDYIAPGLVLMAIINNSYGNVVASFFSAKFQRHIEEMLISPMPNYLIVLGFVIGGLLRGSVVGLVTGVVAAFFVNVHIYHFLIVVLVATLTSVLFSLGGLLNAVFAKTFDDISIVPTFVLTPLTYLGGIFYSVDILSDFWRTLSLANPVLYMINAMRYGMLGVSDINISIAFTIIIVFVIGLYGYAVYLLRYGVGMRQ